MNLQINNEIPMPKVSIGMPVYNGEKYIREAIDSLLNQSYSDFELIISDNASIDTTQKICEEYAEQDPRISYVRQAVNIGPAANFAYVRDKSCAEYFMWAACDDVWDSCWLEKLIDCLESSACDAAFGKVLPIDSNSLEIKHIAVGRTYQFMGNKFLRRLKYYLEPEVLGKANLIYSIYRRKSLDQLDLNSYKYDYSMIYSLLGSVCFNSEANVYLFKRDHSEAFGNLPDNGKNYYSKLRRAIFPFPRILLKEYLRCSSHVEKMSILMLLPYKILLIYIARLRMLAL